MSGDLLAALWPTFVADAREQLERMGDAVLQLERGVPGGAAELDQLRRLAHGLKGSAASLGIRDVEQLAHAIEGLFEDEDGARAVAKVKVDAALQAFSALEGAIAGGLPQGPLLPELPKLLLSLSAATPGGGGALPAPDPVIALESILPVFRAEAQAALEQMKSWIAELSAGAEPDALLQQFQQSGHSLKGSARALGEAGVSDAAARLEKAAAERSLEEVFVRVAELAAALGLTSGAAALAPAPSDELWEIFRAEAIEQVGAVERELAEREKATVASAIEEVEGRLGLLFRSLKEIGASLSRPSLTGAAEAMEAAVKSGRLNDARDQLASVRAVIGRVAGQVAAPVEPAPALLGSLDALETELIGLRSPDLQDRAEAVARAKALAAGLCQEAASRGLKEVVALATALEEHFELLREPGGQPAVLAKAADVLIAIRMALSEVPEPPLPAAEAESPLPPKVPLSSAPAEPVAEPLQADRMVRVSARTVELISQRMEHVAVSKATQERHLRQLKGVGESTGEVLRGLDKQVSRLRFAKAAGWEELAALATRLREVDKALLHMAQSERAATEQLHIVTSVMRRDLQDLRQVPARTFLDSLPRAVREVAGRLGKQVELKVVGEDVKVDRTVSEKLKDPLLHLVRNAVDHGIDRPEARRAAQKSEAGRLLVAVESRGPRIRVEVSDDGAGLSLERIRSTAVQRGLLSSAALSRLSEGEVMQLIFRPGFSTAAQVTSISGRGVGLDVVQDAAKALQGSVEVHSEPGRGTRFVLDFPLSLATSTVVLVSAGGFQVAVPSLNVERLVKLRPESVLTVGGQLMAKVDGTHLPLLRLSDALGIPAFGRHERGTSRAFLLSSGGARVVYTVDSVEGQEEVVLQPLGAQLLHAKHLASMTVVEGVRIVPVLSVPALIAFGQRSREREEVTAARPRILVVDDSLTTRLAMKSVLELAGYEAVTAANGAEALALLQEESFRLVVSDIQMPELDGFELTHRIRADPDLADTRVVLISALATAEDRRAGLAAGADGYLVKSEVEQGGLLEVARQLVAAGGTAEGGGP